MAMSAIEKITRKAKRIAGGKDKEVKPGQHERFTDAAAVGDSARQGDLYIDIVAAVPAGYLLTKKKSKQLVPGETQGARHCLDSLDGVKRYLPENWGPDSLDGPCLVLLKERTITHPTHGHVTIPAGFTVHCRYQREWDAEQRRERRNAD